MRCLNLLFRANYIILYLLFRDILEYPNLLFRDFCYIIDASWHIINAQGDGATC